MIQPNGRDILLVVDVLVVDDACRAIDTDGSLGAAWSRMRAAGVTEALSDQIEK